MYLSDHVDHATPEKVIFEVKVIFSMILPEYDFRPLYQVFYDVQRLFNGEYPGYRECTTQYHDFRHTTDILLAMARLLHGYMVEHDRLMPEHINIGLIAALMHDTGYIQTRDDTEGTGAKYTLTHIQRSIGFMRNYLAHRGYSERDIAFCANCISCTGIGPRLGAPIFESREEELVGKTLGVGDLLGQMADRVYLEKLLFLYYEFREGNVLGFSSELELLRKTRLFYTDTLKRFDGEFEGLNRYVKTHFRVRWNTERDLYRESIEKNMTYLGYLMREHEADYRNFLRRDGLVRRLPA